MVYDQDVVAFLEHHGIKGMHWGIRNKRKQQLKLKKYGDEKVRPLTKSQRMNRRVRTAKRVELGVQVAGAAVFVAAMLKMHGDERASSWKAKASAPKAKQTVEDIINSERAHQVSSLIRTHKEGHIDKDQLDNFLNILNKRYDRKIFEAGG